MKRKYSSLKAEPGVRERTPNNYKEEYEIVGAGGERTMEQAINKFTVFFIVI